MAKKVNEMQAESELGDQRKVTGEGRRWHGGRPWPAIYVTEIFILSPCGMTRAVLPSHI